MITIEQSGDFSKATRYFERLKQLAHISILDKYGRRGVELLKSNTPIESGKTAESWYYEIERSKDTASILFCNSHINKGVPIAIILQYGHGTGTGGWVEGRDYINPVIQPLFDQIVQDAWREVTSL